MVKSNRWPGEYHKSPKAEIDLYPTFDETIVTGIDETVRNLRVISQRSGSDEEFRQYQLQALKELTTEVKELRKEVAKVISALKTKASKTQFDEWAKAADADYEKRITNVFRLLTFFGAFLSLLLGFIAIKVGK